MEKRKKKEKKQSFPDTSAAEALGKTLTGCPYNGQKLVFLRIFLFLFSYFFVFTFPQAWTAQTSSEMC